MTLACPGLSPTSFVYLVEWKCLGCKCTGCPNPNGEGTRILRFNDELTRWDTAARDEVQRRTLDIRSYGYGSCAYLDKQGFSTGLLKFIFFKKGVKKPWLHEKLQILTHVKM